MTAGWRCRDEDWSPRPAVCDWPGSSSAKTLHPPREVGRGIDSHNTHTFNTRSHTHRVKPNGERPGKRPRPRTQRIRSIRRSPPDRSPIASPQPRTIPRSAACEQTSERGARCRVPGREFGQESGAGSGSAARGSAAARCGNGRATKSTKG